MKQYHMLLKVDLNINCIEWRLIDSLEDTSIVARDATWNVSV